jgi:AcrR family transcriptional regulator
MRSALDVTPYARIRNAALEGFAAKGVRATSVREVAAHAGVSPGLVQHHFATKGDLQAAVNEHVRSVAADFFTDLPDSGSPSEIQQELGDRVTAFVRDYPTLLLYVVRACADGDEGALQIFDAFVGIARAQWERLADAGLLRDDVDLAWVPLHVVVLNLGTVLLQQAIGRHLPGPFLAPEQLERWNTASNSLFQRGVYRAEG